MNKYQKQIQQFAVVRDWGQFHNPKDLLLGIVEEIGEIRNIVKWEQDLNKLRQVLLSNQDELEDHVGDILWFLALLGSSAKVDLDKAFARVIKENEKRFPLQETKSKHTNQKLGGIDKKYSK